METKQGLNQISNILKTTKRERIVIKNQYFMEKLTVDLVRTGFIHLEPYCISGQVPL